MRRSSPRLIICSAMLCLLFACSGKTEDPHGTVTVKFWHSFVASTAPALNLLIRTFEEEHPGIKVNAQYIPAGDALVQKLVTAIHSNTAPDISWIHSDFLDKLVEADAIYPMDHFLHGRTGLPEEELEDIFPAALEACYWRGVLYALPMEATSLALLYNRRLFREAGLDPDRPPQTWDELFDYTVRLTKDTDGDGTFDQHGFYVPVFPASGELNIWMTLQWLPFLWQAGGIEIDELQTKVTFNSAAGVAAMKLWIRLYEKQEFSRFGLAHDLAFSSGHVAMILDGPWNLPQYRQVKNFEWAVAPLPAGPVQKATYIAGEQLAIFKQSKHPHEAWTFVKWLLEPRIQSMFSMASGYLPVRRAVLQRPEFQDHLRTDPALKAFVDQMQLGRARRPIDVHRVEINRFLAEAIESAVRGRMAPQEALDEAAAKANALLRSARERKRITTTK